MIANKKILKKLNWLFLIITSIIYFVGFVLLFFINFEIITWLYFTVGLITLGWIIFNGSFTITKILLFDFLSIISVISFMLLKGIVYANKDDVSKFFWDFLHDLQPFWIIFGIFFWASIVFIIVYLIFYRKKGLKIIWISADLYSFLFIWMFFMTLIILPTFIVFWCKNIDTIIASKHLNQSFAGVMFCSLAPTFGTGSVFIGYVYKNRMKRKQEKVQLAQ